MKKIIVLLSFVTCYLNSIGQCSTVSVQISSSDTTYVQLYHAGFFNIPSGFDNICEWEVSTFSGDVIHTATTMGSNNEQAFSLFNHNVPLTDSMKATIFITNNTEGIICTMQDTLYWKETEVLPGSFIGNWDVLSSNGGVEEMISSTNDTGSEKLELQLTPNPAHDYFKINGNHDIYHFEVLNLSGQILASYNSVSRHSKFDLSFYKSGMYFIQFTDANRKILSTKKMIKL